MYKQIITPNVDDRTLVMPGASAPWWWCTYCLGVVYAAWAITGRYGRAILEWDNSPTKHQDKNFPLNTFFIIHFEYIDYAGVIEKNGRFGHIATARFDGQKLCIWSSPYTQKPYYDYFEGDVETVLKTMNQKYGLQGYLGWVEDLSGVRLLQSVSEWQANLNLWEPPVTMYTKRADCPKRWLQNVHDVAQLMPLNQAVTVRGETRVGSYNYYVTDYDTAGDRALGFDFYELQDVPVAVETIPEQPTQSVEPPISVGPNEKPEVGDHNNNQEEEQAMPTETKPETQTPPITGGGSQITPEQAAEIKAKYDADTAKLVSDNQDVIREYSGTITLPPKVYDCLLLVALLLVPAGSFYMAFSEIVDLPAPGKVAAGITAVIALLFSVLRIFKMLHNTKSKSGGK